MRSQIIFLFFVTLIPAMNSHGQIYDPEAAAEYARRWCSSNNNHEYTDYSAYGGDCAAIVPNVSLPEVCL